MELGQASFVITADKASIHGGEKGKTPAAQQCGLENRSTKVLKILGRRVVKGVSQQIMLKKKTLLLNSKIYNQN